LGRGFKFYASAVVGLLVLIALGLVGWGYFSDWLEDRQRPGSTAIRVDDREFTLSYFSDRLRMYVDQVGGPASQLGQASFALPTVADLLVEEVVVLKFAGDEGVSAGEEDINSQIATRLGIGADDPNFDTRFQEELVSSGLSEDEFREMSEATVLIGKIRDKLDADLPDAAESIHYRQIQVADDDLADEIKDQLEGGADFAELATEHSIDDATREEGGDRGWLALGIFAASDPDLELALFDLEVGEILKWQVGPVENSTWFLFEVVETDDAREIEPDQRTSLIQGALGDWLAEKRLALEVVNDMDLTTGDIDKISWAVGRAYGT
jgi:foldase protein PrsA